MPVRITALFIFFSILQIQCQREWVVSDSAYQRIAVDSSFTADSKMLALIKPYKMQLDREMNHPLVEVSMKLLKGKPESTLGNLLADIIKWKAEEHFNTSVDFSIVNYGGIRLPYVNKGVISTRTVYELMPFDNALVIMYLDGAAVIELANRISALGGWPVSGLTFKIRNDLAEEVKINEQVIDMEQTYKMAVSDYIANGGDGMDFLKEKKRDDRYILFRDVLIEYFEEQGKQSKQINAQLSNRITYAE